MGALVLVVGVVGIGAVIGAAIVFAVLRSRRNSANGTYQQHEGVYSPQQTMYPTAQQSYPTAPPNQGYPVPPTQSPQHPNPYAQQPPYQSQ